VVAKIRSKVFFFTYYIGDPSYAASEYLILFFVLFVFQRREVKLELGGEMMMIM
jgi:hypothetical protein